MKKGLFIVLLSATALLFGCSFNKSSNDTEVKNISPSPPSMVSTNTSETSQKVEKPNFTRDTYPKVDGSTATIPLSEAIASNLLGISKEEAKKFIKHNTTHTAYVNLLNGTTDLIFVTEPSKEELKLAEDAKAQLEVIPVVKEGFVFLINSKNPITSLTAKQIQEVYQGKIKNWKDVGGEDTEIIAYQREKNSGSQTLMEQVVMKDLPLIDSPKTIVTGMEGLIDSIAKYDNSEKALGYSVYYYAKTMYNKDTIKFLAVNGVMPDNASISSGKYPFTSAYYAVIKKSDLPDAPSRKLLKWLLGEEGQKIAETSGYVPLQVRE